MTYRRWTEDEFEIVHRVYPTEGGRGVQALLPHRSLISIKKLAHFRCIRSASRRPWSAEETAIVIANYRTLGGKRTALLLPGRDPEDVAAHANMHGVYRFRVEEAA